MTTAVPPLRFDPSGLFVPGSGVLPELLELVHPQLEEARRLLLGGESACMSNGQGGPAARAEDVDLVEQPDRIIADYRAHRQRSELGRMLATARRLAEAVDRVVVVAGQSTLPAVRALVAACCHPYHNELSRAERGGQPRMYFAGDTLDNDALAGLVDLLGHAGHGGGPQDSWGLILIDAGDETQAFCAARSMLLAELEKSAQADAQTTARRCVLIGRSGTEHESFALTSDCDRYELTGGAGGLRSIFDAAGLLPAATLGIDVRRWLEGAVRLNAHFRDQPPADNVVLNYAGALHLMHDQAGAWTPALAAWSDSLRPLACWQNGPAVSSFDPSGVPVTCQAQKLPARRTFPVNLLVDQPRRDRVSIGSAGDRNSFALLPDMLAAAVDQARERAAVARQPWAALHLARLDEASVGQLFQMFLLSSLLAPRLPMVTRSPNSLAPSP